MKEDDLPPINYISNSVPNISLNGKYPTTARMRHPHSLDLHLI